ncbi:MAG TPA: phage holin family protein [Sphingomonadaceae bacterium]|nr:phage holin family protein [Sphingomonadaceae bacterium]
MLAPGDRVERDSISELVGRAVADGKSYASAQVEVVKQTALTGVEKGGSGVGMIVGAGLLAYAALIVFLVAIFTWLEDMIGPIGAGFAVLIGTLAISFILFKTGMGKIREATAAMSGKRT